MGPNICLTPCMAKSECHKSHQWKIILKRSKWYIQLLTMCSWLLGKTCTCSFTSIWSCHLAGSCPSSWNFKQKGQIWLLGNPNSLLLAIPLIQITLRTWSCNRLTTDVHCLASAMSDLCCWLRSIFWVLILVTSSSNWRIWSIFRFRQLRAATCWHTTHQDSGNAD